MDSCRDVDTMPSRFVLFGLGNPGPRYRWTRHNLGFRVLDEIAGERKLRWSHSRRTYDRAEYEIGEALVVLVKPMTFMNVAGRALRAFGNDHGVDPGELLVVMDDITLPMGLLRLRKRGTHGGHNGLRSLIDELGTAGFPRLRMGVGPVPEGEDPADFVLASIPTGERALVDEFIERAVACIEDVVTTGFDRAMSLYNAAPVPPESD
jgi:PTH1 family peptidyl-tRNA hydrolase